MEIAKSFLGITGELGYVGQSKVNRYSGTICYSIIVQISEYDKVDRCVDELLESYRAKIPQMITEMSDEEFNRLRDSAIDCMQSFHDFDYNTMTDDLKETEEAEYILKTLTKQDVLDFSENEKGNTRKLSILLIDNKKCPCGWREKNPEEEENSECGLKCIPREGDPSTIVDINDFKRKLIEMDM